MPETRWNHIAAAELQELLTDVRSVYYVRDDIRGLGRDPEATDTTEAGDVFHITASAVYGSVAERLQAAQDAFDALGPDLATSFSGAIRAAEAAGRAIVERDNALSKLGAEMREMQAALYGGKAYEAETQEQAEMAITVAIALVEWFLSERSQRQSPASETPVGHPWPGPQGYEACAVTGNSTVSTSADGSLASDEALAVLREKLSGGREPSDTADAG